VLAHATDSQLLSLLIGPAAAARIANPSLGLLLEATGSELQEMGLRRSDQLRLMAAAEVARRHQPTIECGEPITEPTRALAVLGDFRRLPVETLGVIVLDPRFQLIEIAVIAQGAAATVGACSRDVLAVALSKCAAAIVAVHSRPFDDSTPTRSDCELTRQMVSAGRVLGIHVIDHLVVTRRSYFSFRAARRL